MSRSVRELLHDAAASPAEPLDFDALRRRSRRRRGARTGATYLAALAIAGLVVTVAARTPDRPDLSPEPPAATASNPLAALPSGWTELPAPPEVRHHGATRWTGTALLMWGGSPLGYDVVPVADGYAFDAGTRDWSPMPASPLKARGYPASVWTGTELLVWGGMESDTRVVGDGAAYDPARRTWRVLPPAPIGARAPLSVWTGEEMLVWGTGYRTAQPPKDGAAYRPATDSWRRIADAPVELSDAVAVWTGTEMIVFGATLSMSSNSPATVSAIGAAYNPSSDTWRHLPDSPLSPQASTAAWSGRELLAWDYLGQVAAYDPNGSGWRRLPDLPFEPGECVPTSVAIERRLIGNFCGSMMSFDSAGQGSQVITRAGLADRWLELIAAGPVLLVLGREVSGGAQSFLAHKP
jgi:hypothetical protein